MADEAPKKKRPIRLGSSKSKTRPGKPTRPLRGKTQPGLPTKGPRPTKPAAVDRAANDEPAPVDPPADAQTPAPAANPTQVGKPTRTGMPTRRGKTKRPLRTKTKPGASKRHKPANQEIASTSPGRAEVRTAEPVESLDAPAGNATLHLGPENLSPTRRPVQEEAATSKPKIRTEREQIPLEVGIEPAPEPVLENAPGLPYPLVRGELIEDNGPSTQELRAKRKELDKLDQTGSLTMRIPTLRDQALLQSATQVPVAPVEQPQVSAAVSSPQPVTPPAATGARELPESLRSHPLPDALQPAVDAAQHAATAEALTAAEEKIETLTRQLAALQSSKSGLQKQNESLQREILDLTQENAKILAQQTESATHGEIDLQNAKLELEKANSKYGVLHAKLQEVIKDRVRLMKEKDGVAAQVSQLEARLTTAEAAAAQARALPALKTELATANGKLKAVVEKYRALNAKAGANEAAAKEYLAQKMALESKLQAAAATPAADVEGLERQIKESQLRNQILMEKLRDASGGSAKEAELAAENTKLSEQVSNLRQAAERVQRLEIENDILKKKLATLLE